MYGYLVMDDMPEIRGEGKYRYLAIDGGWTDCVKKAKVFYSSSDTIAQARASDAATEIRRAGNACTHTVFTNIEPGQFDPEIPF